MSIEIKRIEPTSPMGLLLLAGSTAEQIKRYGRDGARSAQDLVENDAIFVAALLDGVPVGCGAVVELEPKVGELSRIFVDEAARRRGVGAAILRWIEACSREFYDALVLETGVAQAESIALYEALDYRAVPCWGKSESNPLSRCYRKQLV